MFLPLHTTAPPYDCGAAKFYADDMVMSQPTDRPWHNDFPGHFGVATMLTAHEVNYLHWLGRAFHTGVGRVIDLGCFFGGSTVALATGMMSNPRARLPLLTYDSFEMETAAETMFHHPYRAGESFRPVFDIMTMRVRTAVLVREGWLPGSVDGAGERSLYPEQEPVEVLFVDVAKTWPVHLTVLRTFARHLIPGRSILVQQDFKHYYPVWIPIHMHQLRGCFRQVEDIPFSGTIAYEYTGGIESELSRLLQPDELTDPAAIQALWDEIESTWASSPSALVTIKLNRVMHFCNVFRLSDAVTALESLAQWRERPTSFLESRFARVQAAEVAQRIKNRAAALEPRQFESILDRLAAVDRALEVRTREETKEDWLRSCLWRQAASRCREIGASRVALYPAGRHTHAMLSAGFPFGEPIDVVAILDDAPSRESIESIPVRRPADAPHGIEAIIVSSEVYEDAIAAAAERALGGSGIPILRIYEPHALGDEPPRPAPHRTDGMAYQRPSRERRW